MKSRFEAEFGIGQEVYIKTDPEQLLRIVTRITFSARDAVYELGQGINSTCHYGLELTSEKDLLITLNN